MGIPQWCKFVYTNLQKTILSHILSHVTFLYMHMTKFCHILNLLTYIPRTNTPKMSNLYLICIFMHKFCIFLSNILYLFKNVTILSRPQTPSYQRFGSFVTSMWQNLGKKSYAQHMHNPWGSRVYMRCDKILSHLGCISNYILFIFFILITI